MCCTSVSPPFWSAAGSADESPLPADAGNGKLALTPVCLVVANREAVCWFQMRGCTGGAGGRWAALIKENESNNCVSDRCFATGVGTPARAGAVRVIAAAGDFYGVWFSICVLLFLVHVKLQCCSSFPLRLQKKALLL